MEKFLSVNKPALYSSLKDKQPVFINPFKVELLFENKSLIETFNEIRSDFIDFLHSREKEVSLQIETRINAPTEDQKKKYLVNPRDIYKAMAEKNPALEELRKRLGLKL